MPQSSAHAKYPVLRPLSIKAGNMHFPVRALKSPADSMFNNSGSVCDRSATELPNFDGPVRATSDENLEILPYWQVNVPPDRRESECPEFLKNISEKDKAILSIPDSEYELFSWEKVHGIVAANRLEEFRRSPSNLLHYRKYIHELEQKHGSVTEYVRIHRIGWPKFSPRKVSEEELEQLFADTTNIKVLYNDWPYGVDSRIVHLVVWVKFSLPENENCDLTDGARQIINDYVKKTFCKRVPENQISLIVLNRQVIWFKNWTSLKSVQALEHFHVMLLEPDMEFVREITNGDTPTCQDFE